MVKFPERLNTALDKLIADAMAEYKGTKKIKENDWAVHKQDFAEARAEFYYGERRSRVYFDPF